MAALTTLNITEKNANNSLSVTAKVNVTKEGVFTTTLLVKILSSKAISDCIQDGYLSVKDKPFPCFKENRRMNKLRRKFERL